MSNDLTAAEPALALTEHTETKETGAYKPQAWTIEDILGREDTIDIFYKPEGVPDDYPVELLPGVRMKKVDAKTLKAYKATYGGKKLTDGNPERAINNLMVACFVEFLNMESPHAKLGYENEIDYLLNHPKGQLFKEYFMTEFIVREIPSTAEGKGSDRRFR